RIFLRLRSTPNTKIPAQPRAAYRGGPMETFVVLDVAIGLAFIYLLLALICTAINEWISTIFRLRAKTLKRAVRRLVDAPSEAQGLRARIRRTNGPTLSDRVLTHPLIRSISDYRGMPSYIPATRFAAALKATIQSQTKAVDQKAADQTRTDQIASHS